MRQGQLEHALAIARAGRLQEADELADAALDTALAQGDQEGFLSWVPLSAELCDALGRPARAVYVLSLAATFLRAEGDQAGALSLEVDAALRASAARVGEWQSRLEQAFARVVDEGANGWGVESVLGLCEAALRLNRGQWIAEGALEIAEQWMGNRAPMLCASLAVFSAELLEESGRDDLALDAWKLACSLAQSVYAEEFEGWAHRLDQCAARLLSRG